MRLCYYYCEELNNSPQILTIAATDGRLPNTRRNRVVTARAGAVGEKESLETKDGV